ncbi:MAG: hypothetical protein JNL75_04695 [Chitinophagales bacterium]|nr:hypothetical protein [Chitinophagales bacterium]
MKGEIGDFDTLRRSRETTPNRGYEGAAIFPSENPYGNSGQFRTIAIEYNMIHKVTF